MTRIKTIKEFEKLVGKKKADELLNGELRNKIKQAVKVKYKNKQVIYDGKKFGSQKECNYYILRRDEERRGVIKNLKCQPRYLIIDKSPTRRAVFYVWDFEYEKDGKMVVEDIKSEITAKNYVYINKVKQLCQRYPHIIFKETI